MLTRVFCPAATISAPPSDKIRTIHSGFTLAKVQPFPRSYAVRAIMPAAFLVMLIVVARADHAPAYVVPGRLDVPVMINGYDASWGVVEGEWGLYRPGHMTPIVIPASYAAPLSPPAPRYFPSLGAAPKSGRYEIEPGPNRVLPPPAPSFHREWSSSSGADPVTEYAPSPPIIVAPDIRRGRQSHK